MGDFILAPFWFHFGRHWLFIEIVVLLTNLVDIVGLFFLTMIFLVSILTIRNTIFQTLTKKIFKTISPVTTPLFNYTKLFFTSFSKAVTVLGKKTYDFFKNKNKNNKKKK